MAKYQITIDIASSDGKPTSRKHAEFEAIRLSDDTVLKRGRILRDPNGFWAKADAMGAIRDDARESGIELADDDICVVKHEWS